MSSSPLVCVALGFEARAVKAGWPDVDLAVVGMRAPHLDRLAAHDGPVLLLGFGGGLRREQRAGDVIVASEIRDPRGRTRLPRGHDAREALRRAGVMASSGILWCSDAIVRGASRDKLAGAAAVVDMESAPVLDACDADRLVVVRVIVDTPRQGLVRASVLGGRRAKRALRFVSAALAAQYPSITSGTVEMATRAAGAPPAPGSVTDKEG